MDNMHTRKLVEKYRMVAIQKQAHKGIYFQE
jgi:hypothetical protein